MIALRRANIHLLLDFMLEIVQLTPPSGVVP